MGIYSRDYYRESSSWGERIPPVCKYLIIANVVVFLAQIFVTRPPTTQDVQNLIARNRRFIEASKPAHKKTPPADNQDKPDKPDNSSKPDSSAAPPKSSADSKKSGGEKDKESDEAEKAKRQKEIDEEDEAEAKELVPSISVVQEWFELDSSKVLHGQIWRLLTSAFCHDRYKIFHIIFNMLFFYYFGRMLEPLYGSEEFLIFYLVAAFVSSLCYVALDLFTGFGMPAIGASGAVMAVVVLYALLHPREKINLFMIFPIEIRWLVLIYVILDLHPVLLTLAGTPVDTGVANAAHLGGAAFGFFYYKTNIRLEDYWERISMYFRRMRAGGRLRVYHEDSDEPRVDSLDAQVDEILAKIHEHGEASLTDAERKVLQRAANRYQGRNRG